MSIKTEGRDQVFPPSAERMISGTAAAGGVDVRRHAELLPRVPLSGACLKYAVGGDACQYPEENPTSMVPSRARSAIASRRNRGSPSKARAG